MDRNRNLGKMDGKGLSTWKARSRARTGPATGFEDARSRRMARGTRLVIGGFVIAVLGVLWYSVVCFELGEDQLPGTARHGQTTWMVCSALGLGMIGLGAVIWLAGSLTYLSAAMESERGNIAGSPRNGARSLNSHAYRNHGFWVRTRHFKKPKDTG